MKNILKALSIYQEKEFEQPLGKYTKRRLNPLNPLTYLFIAIVFLIGLLKFGFVGIWKEMDTRNPFKYD
jgi:hypothetical protein